MRTVEAIAYFEDAARETDEIIADCSPALQAQLTAQKQHFLVALDALRRAEQDHVVDATEMVPLTMEQLKQMDGDKINIHYIGHCKGFYEDVIAPYYGKYEQYVCEYNGMIRATDLPLQYFGAEWTATAFTHKPGGEQ